MATAGTTEFGSSAFTDRLAQWCLALIDPDADNKLEMNARKGIWEECEKAKQRLSGQESTMFTLRYNDQQKVQKTMNVHIQREDFERLCQPLLDKLGQIIELTFGPHRGQIGRILLTGEGCRMPALMPYLAENCLKVEGNHVTAMGDWVVKGVAIKAAEVERRRQMGNNSPVAPSKDLFYRRLKLTVRMAGGEGGGMQLNCDANMQIPTKELGRFTFEGESVEILLEEDGLQMAKFTVRRNSTDGFNQIAFHIDRNGLLQARLYNSLGQYRQMELLDNANYSNLYGKNSLDLLREELTELSILPRANADIDSNVWTWEEAGEEVEAEDRNAPRLGQEMAELINVLDKKGPNGRANGEHAPQGPGPSTSTCPVASTSSETGGEKEANLVVARSRLAKQIGLHCQQVMDDIAGVTSKQLDFDLDLRKLYNLYAEVANCNCESWQLYVDFLAEAETVRAKHWAHQNGLKVMDIVRNNQWNPDKEIDDSGPSTSPFNPFLATIHLEQDFLYKLLQCADQETVNILYEAFMHSIREEMWHDKFGDVQELNRLMADKYTSRYQQQIAHA